MILDYSQRADSRHVWSKSWMHRKVHTCVCVHVRTSGAGLLLEDRNTCAALKGKRKKKITNLSRKTKVSFDWKFGCCVGCYMFSDQIAVQRLKKFFIALIGCKRFHNHVIRFIPFGGRRINVVNILPLFKMKATEIVVLATKYDCRDTETFTVSVAAITTWSILGVIYIILYSWSSHEEHAVPCAAKSHTATVCLILHVTNRPTCWPLRPFSPHMWPMEQNK